MSALCNAMPTPSPLSLSLSLSLLVVKYAGSALSLGRKGHSHPGRHFVTNNRRKEKSNVFEPLPHRLPHPHPHRRPRRRRRGEGEYVFPVRRQEKRILPPPPRRRRRGGGDGDGDGDEAGHSDGEVRKWFKNIGFLFPPVCSYKMSAWMRMTSSVSPNVVTKLGWSI